MYTIAIIIQIVAIALLFGMICYTLSRKSTVASRNVLVILICTGVAMLGYLFELQADTMDEAMLAVKIGYLGKPFLLLATFYFVARYSKIKTPKWLFWILNSLALFFIIIIYTNEYHHLYYASTELVEGLEGHYFFSSVKGPIYWMYVAMNVGYLVANIVLAVIATKKARSKKERHEVIFIYALIAIGVSGYLIYLFGNTNGYDTTELGFFFDTFIMMILFWKYGLFDTLALAKDKALDIYSNALIVLDTENNIIFTNKTAKKMFPMVKEGGKHFVADKDRLKAGDLYYFEDKIYRFSFKEILQGGVSYGTIIEFRDVTNDVNYNKRLNHEVEIRTHEIQKIQREVIVGFANIVEARNPNTGDHIKKTARYVREIAEALSKMDKYRDEIKNHSMEMYEEVAPLHDVGKIVIPDNVLLKPGRLTPEEFEIMKTHTTAGAELIDRNMSGVETPEYVLMAHNIALSHHERWDGSGYPNGLKGEEIPLEARIMSVADVYDALLSRRPYKETYSQEKAVSIIMQGRGTQFDPEILDVFFSIIGKESK